MSGQLPEPTVIRKTLQSVVQIVALRQKFMGSYAPAWTGSGTIVDKRGIILTNCHVANPRAMGMSAPPADALAIAITERSDEPPAVTYIAEIVAQSPELDLAVLKITQDIKGKKVRNLNLPYINVGDSDKLELADVLAIFGFPGIGGETVTFTSGNVAGFNKQKVTGSKRAWIKTDATIAGGNSGGTAINLAGELVGIPTQAAAGTGITPVDARPVVDTNQDGRVDDRDTPMAVGGFINGLRPVNLAKPLLKQAGVKVTGGGARSEVPTTPPPKPATIGRNQTCCQTIEQHRSVQQSRIQHQRYPRRSSDQSDGSHPYRPEKPVCNCRFPGHAQRHSLAAGLGTEWRHDHGQECQMGRRVTRAQGAGDFKQQRIARRHVPCRRDRPQWDRERRPGRRW